MIARTAVASVAGALLAFGAHQAFTPPTRVATGPAVYRHVTTAPVMITRAEARSRIEANGQTWAQFTAQTTDRPAYDEGFIAAWLSDPTNRN